MLCRVGDVEVWRILEINAPFMTAEDMFPDAGPELAERITENSAKGQFTANSKLAILPVQGCAGGCLRWQSQDQQRHQGLAQAL